MWDCITIIELETIENSKSFSQFVFFSMARFTSCLNSQTQWRSLSAANFVTDCEIYVHQSNKHLSSKIKIATQNWINSRKFIHEINSYSGHSKLIIVWGVFDILSSPCTGVNLKSCQGSLWNKDQGKLL